MAKKFQIKRGNKANLPTLAPGEFGLCLDSEELYIGGSSKNIKVNNSFNPNLLDNWYFGNPVNQRGQASYKGAVYGIDRWRSWMDSGVATINDGYIHIEGSYCQPIEPRVYIACSNVGNITCSYLTKDGTLGFATAYPDNVGSYGMEFNVGGWFNLIPSGTGENMSAGFDLHFYNDVADVVAVKLELGAEQTLAHKNESGNWVLNEIPNYSEQLLRCCMSKADSSDDYANNRVTPAAIGAVSRAEWEANLLADASVE